jgi:hypothetical protein
VGRYLAPRQALVVLDNCEYVVESTAEATARLLDAVDLFTDRAHQARPQAEMLSAARPAPPRPETTFSALAVRRGAGELDADEGLITHDAGVVARRDRVRVTGLDRDPGAIGHPRLQLA